MTGACWLGAGIGYRRAHRDALLDDRDASDAARPRVLEIMPDHFFADPAAIEPLAQRYPLVFHDVGMSIATAGDTALAKARLRRVAELVGRARPVLFSDHLAVTRSPSGLDLGHLAPVWLVDDVLDLVCDRVRALQDVLGVPIALENIAPPFVVPGATMTEPEFFARLVDRTGCGLLLDLTNLALDAKNRGFDARARLAAYPLAAVVQVHLAGGVRDRDGTWIDSHSAPVDDDSFALVRELARARPPNLRAIIIERDDHLGALAELVAEAERARALWEDT